MSWLKDARVAAGLTQAAVAAEAKLARGAYANIETGERRPSVQVAKRIAAVLGIEWTRFYDATA